MRAVAASVRAFAARIAGFCAAAIATSESSGDATLCANADDDPIAVINAPPRKPAAAWREIELRETSRRSRALGANARRVRYMVPASPGVRHREGESARVPVPTRLPSGSGVAHENNRIVSGTRRVEAEARARCCGRGGSMPRGVRSVQVSLSLRAHRSTARRRTIRCTVPSDGTRRRALIRCTAVPGCRTLETACPADQPRPGAHRPAAFRPWPLVVRLRRCHCPASRTPIRYLPASAGRRGSSRESLR